MECIYSTNLNSNIRELVITGEEARHLRALRIRPGEKVMVTNGSGLLAETELVSGSKDNYLCRLLTLNENYHELPFSFGLAIGILDSRDRLEFAFEKAIELGVKDFYPLMCDYCQKKEISINRLESKAIAAIKQCQRSTLPRIHEPVTVKNVLSIAENYKKIFLADISGKRPLYETIRENSLVMVGPEGGFSDSELNLLIEDSRVIPIKLAGRRLRAETAALAALTCLSINIEFGA